MSQEFQDWKEKYLSSVERFERLKTADKERIDLLCRMFVRVSVAADGQDEALDDALADMRSLLRSNSEILELEPELAKLERLVVALDERRQQELRKLERMIDDSLQGYLDLDLKRKDKSAIKKYQRMVPKLLKGSGNELALWSHYAEIQNILAAYIAEILEHNQGDTKAGFFQRLFAGDDEQAHQEKESTEAADAELQTEAAQPQGNDFDLESKLLDEQVSTVEITSHGNLDQQRELLKQRIAGVLVNLLRQVELASDSEAQKQVLIQAIEHPFEWEQLPELLERTGSLVTNNRIQAQKEFEHFLVALHERLQEIQDFLNFAREGEELSLQNQQKLDADVRSELQDIKLKVVDSEEIQRIKLDIETMVERIVGVVDDFHQLEQQRRDEAYQRIEQLGQQMSAMEAEAAELRANLEASRLEAMKDALTSLPNRQAYDEYMEREYSRWKRHQHPLSIAICDIDHFKAINDSLGHLRGDKVLKLVAREITSRVRSEDFAARYGGEEFVVIMPDTDQQAAKQAMDKIRRCIEECPFNFNNQRVQVTASFGVATFVENDSIESCFDRADKALYQAKGNGRNQVVGSDEPAVN